MKNQNSQVWINCSEKMPQNYTWVKVKTLYGREGIATYASRWTSKRKSGFRLSDWQGDEITHWQPITTSPE